MQVYVAMNSAPDYSAPPPAFHSVHKTLEGAITALYPKGEVVFRHTTENTWEGPDGFGLVRLVEVYD